MGILRSFSIEDVHETNGAAERCWDVLQRCMRAMIAHAGGSEQQARFWPYLMLVAAFCHNYCWSFAPDAIHIFMAGGGGFDLRKLRVMLCDCFVLIKASETFDRLAPRRVKGVHLGYNVRRRGYFVYLPDLERITTACDVEFVENSFSLLSAVRAIWC